MRRLKVVGVLAIASAWAVACNGDDVANPVDAGQDHAVAEAGADSPASQDGPATNDGATTDSAIDAATDAAARPARLLVTYGISTSSLYVVDVAGKAVAGTLAFPGAFGAPFVQPSAPFLLEQAVDVVARLDPNNPWTIDSTWSIALNDAPDSSLDTYADPYAVLVAAANKAYVLRYTRNEIAVIDESQTADGGAPVSTIDLSSLLQPGDSDGAVEMTAGVYVPATKLLYVVLGNIDRNLVVNNGATLLCSNTASTLIAIDTMTDTIVDLDGTQPGGGIALSGFDPIPGGVAYDAVGGRLLIDSAGCNQDVDGGAGSLVKRLIESVTLSSGQTQTLHDGTSDGYPSTFVYIDTTHAVVGYDFTGTETYAWDPTQPSFGSTPIPNAPDAFVSDGAGNLLGTRTTFASDGGSTTDVVSVRISDGTSTTLAANPFPAGGFVGGVDLWPRP